jgi:Zn ribbon nucleic-acid-binding protein
VVWPQLQPHHRQQVQTAIRNRLIADGASGYTATADGRRFIGPPVEQEIPGKVCPACHEDKEADQFWADPNRSDGLFYYCISCESNRRKESRRMKREQRERLQAAGALAKTAATQWDEACAKLAQAWASMNVLDGEVRILRAQGATTCDWGQLDLRIIHQAAVYQLAKGLLAERFPWPGSFLHNDAMPTSLAAWIGENPAEPYLSAGNSKLEEDADGSSQGNDAPERGEGTSAWRAEQGDDGVSGDHPEAARVQLAERQPVAEASRRGRPRKSA